MGLCSDLNDVSSDSIPLLLLALFAHGVRYLKSLFICFLQAMGLWRYEGEAADGEESLMCAVGSGLGRMIAVSEHLNRACTWREGDDGSDCVVCLCRLRGGQQVRRLACSHVFHKECLDGWLDHSNVICPLCRAPMVQEERVVGLERRVERDLFICFSPTW